MRKNQSLPLYRTFTNWIISVVIGSLLLPFACFAVGGNNVYTSYKVISDETFGMILFSMVFSAVFSAPALVILFFAHWILNNKTEGLKNHQLIQNGVHIFAALATFIVMGILFGNNDRNFLFAIILAYFPTGIVVWNITYWLYKKKKVLHKINSEILDEV